MTPLEAAATLAGQHGLRYDEIDVLKHGSNLLVRLAPAPVVLRIATFTALIRGDPLPCLEREVALVSYLASEGASVMRPSDLLPPGPHIVGGWAMSAWQYVVHEQGAIPDPITTLHELDELHAALRAYPGELPLLNPAADDLDRALRFAVTHDVYSPAQAEDFRARRDEVMTEFARAGARIPSPARRRLSPQLAAVAARPRLDRLRGLLFGPGALGPGRADSAGWGRPGSRHRSAPAWRRGDAIWRSASADSRPRCGPPSTTFARGLPCDLCRSGSCDHRTVTERILTRRHLNRALLARQLLLERSTMSIPEAVEQIGGLQTQYAPSGYVGLWTRLADFRREALTDALEERSVVQATLMRTTIHVVSAREFWRYAMGVRRARRDWALKTPGRKGDEASLIEEAQRMRAALDGGPRTVKELGELGAGFVGNLGLWVDLVRVPPSGTWERRRADRLALAEDWVGPTDASEDEGLEHLVRAYLRAFGPAAWRDIASWAGISVSDARRGGEGLALARYRDEDGRELVDLENAPLPDPDTPAPVRFLPHWDANLLVHARRTGLLPEAHRPRVFSIRNPFSVGTYLVDGVVAGAWSLRDGHVELDAYETLATKDQRAVHREREALEAFHL